MKFCGFCGCQCEDEYNFCHMCGKELIKKSKVEDIPSVEYPEPINDNVNIEDSNSIIENQDVDTIIEPEVVKKTYDYIPPLSDDEFIIPPMKKSPAGMILGIIGLALVVLGTLVAAIIEELLNRSLYSTFFISYSVEALFDLAAIIVGIIGFITSFKKRNIPGRIMNPIAMGLGSFFLVQAIFTLLEILMSV